MGGSAQLVGTAAAGGSPEGGFRSRGFVLLPGLLGRQEVGALRQTCLDHFSRSRIYLDCGITQPDAFRNIPQIRWLLKHPPVLAAFRRYCGERLVYCHHSDVHLNKYTGWHKDACGSSDFSEDGLRNYAVYKLALYLQDHSSGGPALTVRSGSHLLPRLHDGEPVEIRPKVGDGILFDCRISHRGQDLSPHAKVIRSLLPSQRLRSGLFGGLRKLFAERDKLAVFFTLGRPNQFLDEHVRISVDRQLKQIGEQSYELPDGMASLLGEAGLGWQGLDH